MEEDIKEIQEAYSVLYTTVEALRVKEKMEAFDAKNATKPLYKVMCQYMQMVVEMLAFIKSVRTGNWKLHLAALQAVTKYFFAHERLVYVRMIPLYLADVENLQRAFPEIYKEFCQGNWVVNKNPEVLFCVLGADHALEHVNHSMRVSDRLIGITLNLQARTKFFLVAPELARLAEEAQDMAGLTTSPSLTKHLELPGPTLQRQEVNVMTLTDTFRNFTDPFALDSDVLFNLATMTVMPNQVRKDLCSRNDIGTEMFEGLVTQRIISVAVNLWAPMKKTRLQMWKCSAKRMKVTSGNKSVELQEDRSLFARMVVVSRARPGINVKELVGKHEFSVVLQSLIAPDGSMLHSLKSSLMKILENLR